MILLSGTEVAKASQIKITQDVLSFKKKYGQSPKLDVILVGNDSASQVYVKNKKVTCEKVGMIGEIHHFSSHFSQNQILDKIFELNADDSVDGVLLQLPVPEGILADDIVAKLNPLKDPDCLTPENVGLMWLGRGRSLACTPMGIKDILLHYKLPLAGKNAVVVGRSNIVGKPMAQILLDSGCTVTICHSKTQDLKHHTTHADIVVVAMGKPQALGKEYFKKGAVVIDVGIHRGPNGLCGDVKFDEVKEVASAITPVPGGVGPMTINSLIKNTLALANFRRENI